MMPAATTKFYCTVHAARRYCTRVLDLPDPTYHEAKERRAAIQTMMRKVLKFCIQPPEQVKKWLKFKRTVRRLDELKIQRVFWYHPELHRIFITIPTAAGRFNVITVIKVRKAAFEKPLEGDATLKLNDFYSMLLNMPLAEEANDLEKFEWYRAVNKKIDSFLTHMSRPPADAPQHILNDFGKLRKQLTHYKGQVQHKVAEFRRGALVIRNRLQIKGTDMSLQPPCIVYRIKLLDHPTNPKLKIGQLGEHIVVVGDHYDDEVLGFHIPPGAIVPDALLEDMWLVGKLSGKQKNKVKNRSMDGVQSEGLFYGSRFFQIKEGEKVYVESRAWKPHWKEGDDVAFEVGVQ